MTRPGYVNSYYSASAHAAPERPELTGSTDCDVGVGVGGIVSNAASGWLLDHGGVNAPLLVGGLGAIALGCAVTRILPPPESPRAAASPSRRALSRASVLPAITTTAITTTCSANAWPASERGHHRLTAPPRRS